MVTTDNAGKMRQALILKIDQDRADRAERIRSLRKEITDLEAQQEESLHQLLRAQRFDVSIGICPICAIERGETVELKAIPIAAIALEGEQVDVDALRCPSCGWDDIASP